MTRFNLLVGGPQALYPSHWQRLPGDWVGVDRGTLHLLEAGIAPAFAVGDFDSLTEVEHQRVGQQVAEIHAKSDMDETDTDMAVRLAFGEHHATEVCLVGATGGRIDHFLSNLFMPTQPQFAAYTNHITMLDAENNIRFYQPGHYQLTALSGYHYLGIVPLTAVSHLEIQGAKYPLHDWSSQTPFSWASNEFLAGQPTQISWTAGIVAVIQSRDRRGQKLNN